MKRIWCKDGDKTSPYISPTAMSGDPSNSFEGDYGADILGAGYGAGLVTQSLQYNPRSPFLNLNPLLLLLLIVKKKHFYNFILFYNQLNISILCYIC